MTSNEGAPLNLDTMTAQEFQEHLPELFERAGSAGISDDPRFTRFLADNPTCAALVRDLEYIAETARQLLHPIEEEPSDNVWNSIQDKLKIAAAGEEPVD